MGGFFSKSDKTNEEILNDIEELNKITNNELFYKKTGYRLYYIKSSHFFKSIIGGKIIICQIVSIYSYKYTY
jgi:NifB/MoaA-like Fe-S oxidoreductase